MSILLPKLNLPQFKFGYNWLCILYHQHPRPPTAQALYWENPHSHILMPLFILLLPENLALTTPSNRHIFICPKSTLNITSSLAFTQSHCSQSQDKLLTIWVHKVLDLYFCPRPNRSYYLSLPIFPLLECDFPESNNCVLFWYPRSYVNS